MRNSDGGPMIAPINLRNVGDVLRVKSVIDGQLEYAAPTFATQPRRWQATKLGKLITPGATNRAYWPQVIDVTDMDSWPCDYIMTFSTDHSTGGIYLWVCTGDPSASANWKSYDAALANGDFDAIAVKPAANPIYNPSTIGTSVETAHSLYVDGKWYVTTHQAGVPGADGIQTTTLSIGEGETGLLDLAPAPTPIILDYDPAEFPGDGHCGYFVKALNPFPAIPYKFIGYSIHGGTNDYHLAQWGSDDLETWDRLAILDRENDLIGLPSGWVMATQISDFGTLADGNTIAIASSVVTGGAIRDSQLYQVSIDDRGRKFTSQAIPFIEQGESGEFDSREIDHFTTVDHNGQKYLFYTATDDSNANTIGVAAIELKSHTHGMPKLSPARDDFTFRRYHDFTSGTLPSWLETAHTGSGSHAFVATGIALSASSGNWAGMRLKNSLTPDTVGRIAIRLYGSYSTVTTRIPVLGFFEATETGDLSGDERAIAQTYSSIAGRARLEIKSGGVVAQTGDDLYDWGYQDNEATAARSIGLDWHCDSDQMHLVVGDGFATYESVDASAIDTSQAMRAGISASFGNLVIGAIEILWGRD